MSKYKVLWIDDQWEKMDSFKDVCEDPSNDIEIIPFKYSDEGMKAFEEHLEEWSGVILDAKCLINRDAQIDNLKGLTFSIKKIEQLSSRRKVPYYIFTGQPDTASGTAFAEEHSENYYEKDKDEDRLIEDIKINGDRLYEMQLIHKHQLVFDLWPESKHELLRILTVFEKEDWNNNSVLNDLRKVLSDVTDRCYERGICTVKPDGSNLAECSRMLGQKFMEEFIPIYVQRSIHSTVSITNPGSHRSATDEDVRSNKAPYLVRSLIYEMLNVLYWANRLPSIEQKPLMLQLISEAQEKVVKK